MLFNSFICPLSWKAEIVFYIGRTKQGLHDRLTEQFKALAKNDNSSAIADRVDTNGPNTD